jgi:hypothetical protein
LNNNNGYDKIKVASSGGVCVFWQFCKVVKQGGLLFEPLTGTGTGFQVRGAHLKIYRRAEGGTNIFGVFRVKNHDFIWNN